jgi:SWI/SNF-related matrix-associated actin-dependent regulator of chromatin subfamily A member 5
MEEKMIEKQTMKLKLDSLIIQKGRLAPKHTGLQKEELQDMVNFGADEIFKMGSCEVQDEDIDLLIKRGLERAEGIQKKAEGIVKDKMNMLDFQMNTVNMYEFEDVDYLQEKRKEQEKAIKMHVVEMLNEEVRLGRREKKNA